MKISIKKIWLFFLILFFYIPSILFFLKIGVENSSGENRELSNKPDFSISNYLTFSKEYNDYFQDNLPYRNKLIRINNLLTFYCLKDSPNEEVILGKDGWLFYNKESDGLALDSYLGRESFTQEELETIKNNVEVLDGKCKERNIEFVLMICPDKEQLYSDKIPGYYKKSGVSKTDQVVDYLKANTDIRIVYPKDEIMNITDRDTYYHLDTHWNYLGGYLGAKELLEELGIDLPEYSALSLAETDASPRDLSLMMNLQDSVTYDVNYYIQFDSGYNVNILEHDEVASYRSNSDIKNGKKIMLARDSYMTAMAPYIEPYYEECFMPHRKWVYNDGLLDDENPDVFVYQIVGRSLHDLLDIE